MKIVSPKSFATLLVVCAVPALAFAQTVSITTADGDGADAEVRQFKKDSQPDQTDVNFGNAPSLGARVSVQRGFNASFVRFDISAYSDLTFPANTTLKFTKYRDEDLADFAVFGLDDGLDNWIEGDGGSDDSPSGELTYNNAPGILQDSDPLNGGSAFPSDIDPATTSALGAFSGSGNEGDVLSFSNASLTQFLNGDTDGLVTFIVTANDQAKGLSMLTSKEATSFKSGAAISGSAAPELWFDIPTPPGRADYGALADGYVDAMLTHGRDTYGSVQSPLFAAQMVRDPSGDYVPVDPHSVFPNMNDYGLRYDDRPWGSSNPNDDVSLFNHLYQRSDQTGDATYADAADDAIQYTFDNLRSPATDLLAWGEEMSWMLHFDAPRLPGDGYMDGTFDGRPHDNDIHEPSQRWSPELWDRAFALSPTGAKAVAQGLWDHQISNQTTGDFSRHAKYSAHDPGSGPSFPRVGSWMMLAWAKGYEHVDGDAAFDAEMLDAIETIVDSYNGRRDPVTDALPAGTDARYDNVYWTTNNLTMAVEVGQIIELGVLPPALETKLEDLATRTDQVILTMLEHNLDGHLDGVHPSFTRGFQYRGWTDVVEDGHLKFGDPRHTLDARSTFSDFWTAGYGSPLTSGIALTMLERYEQLGDTTNGLAYRGLAVEAADLYLTSEPDTSLALHPSALGTAIEFMLEAYALEGDMAYLDRAAYFGNWAGELFFDDASGLPKVTSDHDFYEVGSGGGELALALADLENAVEDLLLGDANLDGDVDGLDIGVLVDNFGGDGGFQDGDFNFDGVIDGLDIGILVSNFGGSAAALEPLADLGYESIPEPTSLILFTVAGAALLRRGRRAA